MDKRTTAKIIGVACTIVIVAFFIGAFFKMPYEFYKTMRWFLLGCFGACAYVSLPNKWLCSGFVFWALVYNPIWRPAFTTRHVWELINVATVAWLLFWLLAFVFSRKDEKAQKELEDASLELSSLKRDNAALRKQIANMQAEQGDVMKALQNKIVALQNILTAKTDGSKVQNELKQELQRTNNMLTAAALAWRKWIDVVRGDGKTAIGLKYEIFIAKKWEAEGWNVDLEGNMVWAYDLLCSKPGQKQVYVECKCWSRGTVLTANDLDRFFNFIEQNKGTRGVIYTTTTLNLAAEQRARALDIRVYQTFSMSGVVELIRAYNGHYYTPIDQKYRVFKHSDDAQYFATTFEAALAGYSRG